jgi:hypothetical protein
VHALLHLLGQACEEAGQNGDGERAASLCATAEEILRVQTTQSVCALSTLLPHHWHLSSHPQHDLKQGCTAL